MRPRLRARFRLLVAGQVALLAATALALAWALSRDDLVAVRVVIAAVFALQTIVLLRHVEQHIAGLEEFFAAINFEDFTRRFTADDIDAELRDAFNLILEQFQDARAQREVQAQYLETVVRHVPVPLMAVRDDGRIRLMNYPARRLTGIATLTSMADLAVLDETLPARLADIQPGQQRLIQTRIRDMPIELRVAVSEIRLEGRSERLYSLENLSGELSDRESSAWRNLIRVLTHEIMNTLTPVTSLAQTSVALLDDPAGMADVREAVETIARRSAGLTSFVARYRELLKVPEPRPQTVPVRDALQSAVTLLRAELADVRTQVSVVPPSLAVQADPDLLDQVLVNLVKNAADALRDQPGATLTLDARLDHGRVMIALRDNGPGIPAAEREQVFIPFFTTKRDGSGIGLSLCRQIMSAHGGAISLDSDASGTVVRLLF